ncbi:MAG: excisionase family DNA-binding protein [Actinomycetia bacterium]|nr:excisionase family DNA-binding protein [Actinomycetes bacterium]
MTHELRDPDHNEPTSAWADAPATLADFLRRHPTPTAQVQLVEDDSAEATMITVPSEALKMFIEILDHLKDGIGVSIVPANSELTTQQAADLLGVSRPYLIGRVLTPAGPLPFRTVGRHRRIRFSDLDSYRREDELRRKAAADAVSQLGIDAGLDD